MYYFFVLNFALLNSGFAIGQTFGGESPSLGCEEFLTRGQTTSVLRLMKEGRGVQIFTRVLGQKIKTVVVVKDSPLTFKHSPSGRFAQSQFNLFGRVTRSSVGIIEQGDRLSDSLAQPVWRLQAIWSLAKARVARTFKPKAFTQSDDEQMRAVMQQHFIDRYAVLGAKKRAALISALERSVTEDTPVTLSLAKETRNFSPILLLNLLKVAEAKATENLESYRALDHWQDLEGGARRSPLGWLRTTHISLGFNGMVAYLASTWPGPWDLRDPLFAVLFANMYYEAFGLAKTMFNWTWANRFYPFRNVSADARNRAVAVNLDQVLRDSTEDQILVVTLPTRYERLTNQLERSGFDILPLDYDMLDTVMQMHIGTQLIAIQ